MASAVLWLPVALATDTEETTEAEETPAEPAAEEAAELKRLEAVAGGCVAEWDPGTSCAVALAFVNNRVYVFLPYMRMHYIELRV